MAESGWNETGYADSSAFTLASGAWQQTTGAAGSSASGATQWDYSASGLYGYGLNGGSVSGTWQQSGSASTSDDTATASTLGGDGAWTRTGATTNGEGGGQHIGYSGSGGYAVAAAAGSASLSGSGTVIEAGSDDWGYGYAVQSTIGSSGRWLPATGSGGTTETEADMWGYAASGAYTRPLGGGSLSGSWQANGGSSDGYTAGTTATLNPNGSWTTTGVADSSGSGSGAWAYSGAGAYDQSSSSGNAASGSSSSFSSQATESFTQGWSSQYDVVSTLAATGIVLTVTTVAASGSSSGNHTYSSSASSSSWVQTGNYAAGNGTSSGSGASSGVTLAESMQTQWQENYVLTAGPSGTTTTGGASGGSQGSGDASWYSSGSGFSESNSSGSGYSYASGASWASGVSGQDHYNDQTSWSEPWNLVGLSGSGTTVNNVWGNATTSWSNGTWSSMHGSGSGSGSGSGYSTSSATGGSTSTSYNQDVNYSGFAQSAGFLGLAPGADSGWRWSVGWAGAGTSGPLGPTAYSGLGYAFAPGDTVTVASINDQSDAEGQAVSIPVQASDAAGAGGGSGSSSGPVYSAQDLPAGVSINAQTGLISGAIAEGAYAQGPLYDSTVTVTDAAGHSGSTSFLWLIANPVTLASISDQSGVEGAAVDLTPQAVDVNGGDLFTWTETGLPAGLSLDPDGGAVTGTPAAGSAGVYVVTLTATDGGAAGASQTFLWTVAPAVTITDPGVQSVTEGDTVALQIQAKDATGGALNFTETGLPPGLAISSDGDVTGQISSGDAAGGPYVATITASDGTYSATQDIVWAVSDPVAVTDPGPQSSTEGDTVTLQIPATDSTGGTLSYSETGLPPGLSINAQTGVITGAPTTAGFYDATITATDGSYSGATTIGWDVGVSAVSLTDPGSQSNTEGDSITLQMQGTDAEGLPLEYSADELPAGLNLNPQTGAITGTIASGAAGYYETTITAADADFDSASQTFSWNIAPAVTMTDPGRQKNTEGDAVSLQVQATDAIGTPTFTADNLPPGLQISSGGLITGTILAGAAVKGRYDVTITATDGTYSATQTMAWSVAPAVTLADPGAQFNLEGDHAALQLKATDATGGTLSFSATGLPAGLEMSDSGAVTGTVADGAAAKGPYDVTVTATDGLFSATEKLTWELAAAPAGTWSGDTAALDAFYIALGTQGRMAFDNLVEQTDQNSPAIGYPVYQPGQEKGYVELGTDWQRLLGNHIRTKPPWVAYPDDRTPLQKENDEATWKAHQEQLKREAAAERAAAQAAAQAELNRRAELLTHRPVDLIEGLAKDGLAIQHNDYVYIPTVVGDSLLILVYQRKEEQKVLFSSASPFGPPATVGTGEFYYQLLKSWHEPLTPGQDVGDVLRARLTPDQAKRYIDGAILDHNARESQAISEVVGVVYDMLPFGAFWDNLAQGNLGEATLSLLGDLALFAGFAGGPLAEAGGEGTALAKGLTIASISIEVGVGTTRGAQAIFEFREGRNEQGAVYLGEAFLRLLGASAQSLAAIRVAAEAGPVLEAEGPGAAEARQALKQMMKAEKAAAEAEQALEAAGANAEAVAHAKQALADATKEAEQAVANARKVLGVAEKALPGTAPRLGSRRISDALYDELRTKTPTPGIRDKVNAGKVPPFPDEALPGLTVTDRLQADHIVSMDTISRMEGFEQLTREQQLEVLNNSENFVGLSETANKSKGAKSFREWIIYKKGGIGVDPAFRQHMMKEEARTARLLQQQIDDFLKK